MKNSETAEEIAALLRQTLTGVVEINEGVVHYYDSFEICGDEEPHDVAWSRSCSDSEAVEGVGLEFYDTWSDNDSYGGYVRQKQKG